MSGSKRCCCGKAEGCDLCETFFNQPIPQSTWCNTVYTFTFPSTQLPALRANYKQIDYQIQQQVINEECQCDPSIVYQYNIASIDAQYDFIDWDPNTLSGSPPIGGLTWDADPREKYPYEIGENIFSAAGLYETVTAECCGDGTQESVKSFIGIADTIPYLTGITYTRDPGFKATFRACGFNNIGTPRTTAPTGASIVFNTIDSVAPAVGGYFNFGVTYQNANPALIKKIMYIPVIRTIGGSTVPTQAEDCWTTYNQTTQSGLNSPRRLSCEPEDCRCESLLVVKVKNYFIAKSQQFILNSNGSFFIQTNPAPLFNYAESTLWLYYYGCLDGYIYGDNSAPVDRTFVLDGGFFEYRGHAVSSFNNALSSNIGILAPNSQSFTLFPFPTSTINYIPEEVISPLCSQIKDFGPSPSPRRYLPANYLINELQMPAQLIVSRV
jgi:hypothetical protein